MRVSNVPALNLTFDTRTRELCEYLNLPTFPLHKFDDNVTLNELFSLADYSLFNETYAFRYDRYSEFLVRNGVDNSLEGERIGNVKVSSKVAASNIENLLGMINMDSVSDDILIRYIKDLMEPTRSLEERKKAESGSYQ